MLTTILTIFGWTCLVAGLVLMTCSPAPRSEHHLDDFLEAEEVVLDGDR